MKMSRTLACLGVLLLAACGSPSQPHSAAPPPEGPRPPSAVPAVPAAVAKAPDARVAKVAKAEAPKPTTRPAPSAATPAKPAPAPAPTAAAPALDLKALEERLKGTDAIGVLTKLSLKNQVDDLVTRFRAFHAGSRPPTLAELRPAFDLLLMKVMSLLQDKDAALARDIHASREALWAVLADAGKLARYS